MIQPPKKYSFLCNADPVESVFRDAICDDLNQAELSPIFKLYYKVRSLVPIPVRQQLQRRRNAKLLSDPDWFLPTAFESRLTEALSNQSLNIIHPWPNAAPFGLVLTHDVETAEGMKLIEPIAKIEEELGLRSCWNVVSKKYPVDMGIVRDLQQRGFEIGVHGYNHDGRLFESEDIFNSRLPVMKDRFVDFGATGFRAPMVHRNLDWIAEMMPEYDASCFDVDPFQAMPGGIGTVWPCMANGMVELPYTMPQDHTLFVSLAHDDTSVWQRKFEYLRQRSGMVLMLTHPDYMDTDRLRSMYRDFLKSVIETPHWHALPREVAAWWREREQHDPAALGLNSDSRFRPAKLSAADGQIKIEEVAHAVSN